MAAGAPSTYVISLTPFTDGGDLDQAGLRGGVAASWTVTGLPQTWFVARDGSRAGRIGGRLTVDDLRTRVDELLAGS